MSSIKLFKKVILRGTLHVRSGLHIGAGQDRAEIGGLDNPVVRVLLKNNTPYVPGSSLKGKIRSLLEQAYGVDCLEKPSEGKKHNEDGSCPICQVFGGSTASKNSHASRIVFRDAYLSAKSEALLRDAPTDLPYTEVKAETAIDRLSGQARDGTLRSTERVPAGAEFDVEIVVNVYEGGAHEPSEDMLRNWLKAGIDFLNHDYLGGSGSRGYGHVELSISDVEVWKVSREEAAVTFQKEAELGAWETLKEKAAASA